MPPSTPQPFTDVTLAAVACALGGQLVHQDTERGRLVFHIVLPTGVDLSDPTLRVPVPGLCAWVDVLAQKVRAHRKTRTEGGQR
jgi:hypothetical protein